MPRRGPIGIRFTPLMWAELNVIAAESRRSASWMVLEILGKALEENHSLIIRAAQKVLAKDKTNGHATLVIEAETKRIQAAEPVVAPPQAVSAMELMPRAFVKTTIEAPAAPPVAQEKVPVTQPVFGLEALAPTNPLPFAVQPVRPAAAPAPAVQPRAEELPAKPATPPAELDPEDWAERARNRRLVNS
jgi:hypothetical protein